MPQAVAAVTAAVTAVATYVGAAVGGFVAGVTGSVALGGYVSTGLFYATELTIYVGLSALLVPKIPKPEGGLITLKQSVPPRARAFGRVRSGGSFVLWTAREDYALDVIAFHDGEISRFNQFYLNDDQVEVDAGVVQEGADGRYPPPQVKLQWRTGLATETPYDDLIAQIPTVWTTAHRGDGVASVFASFQNGKAVHQYHNFPNGEPVVTAEYDAQPVFDPRDPDQDPSDPSTWSHAGIDAFLNPACQLLTYLMRERGYAYDWSVDEVGTFNAANYARRFAATIDYWIKAAEVCDEQIALAAPGQFEQRYRCSFRYALDQAESSIVNTFLVAMDGWMGSDGNGGFIVYAGEFTAPQTVLMDADIKGYSCERGVQVETDVNQINATITDPAKAYNTSEVEPWVDAAAVAIAGTPLAEQLDLPQVQSYTQARRLMKRRMDRHRALARGSMTVDLSTDEGKIVLGQRYLQIKCATGPAVMADLIIEVTDNLVIDLSNWTVSFTWTSVDPQARDGWTPETDEGAAPPPGDTPGSEPLIVPVIDTISAFEVDGGRRLALNVTGPDRADLDWEARWRLAGATLWQPSEFPDDGGAYPSPALLFGLVPADTDVEAQVRYSTGGGLTSDWSDVATVDTSGIWPTWDSTTITLDSLLFTLDATP